ncbi:MAG: hypothetical protein R3E61_06305 [Pseudomonadales bacterium]|jgi:hypothetical protein
MKKDLERRLIKLEQEQGRKTDPPIVVVQFVSPERPWDDDCVAEVTCGDYRLRREPEESYDELISRAKGLEVGAVWYAAMPDRAA